MLMITLSGFVAVNYRLKSEDIEYILAHAEVEALIVDAAFVDLVMGFCKQHPDIVLLVDLDTDGVGKELSGPYDQAVHEGLRHDIDTGGAGWDGLETQAHNEDGLLALAYTSGTTARPKGVEYTHRGAYMAALANIIESGLNFDCARCRYLWTLPMFHAMGMFFKVQFR
jgi:long-subunit acyl-CoA synthetase (AMP-forming)